MLNNEIHSPYIHAYLLLNTRFCITYLHLQLLFIYIRAVSASVFVWSEVVRPSVVRGYCLPPALLPAYVVYCCVRFQEYGAATFHNWGAKCCVLWFIQYLEIWKYANWESDKVINLQIEFVSKLKLLPFIVCLYLEIIVHCSLCLFVIWVWVWVWPCFAFTVRQHGTLSAEEQAVRWRVAPWLVFWLTRVGYPAPLPVHPWLSGWMRRWCNIYTVSTGPRHRRAYSWSAERQCCRFFSFHSASQPTLLLSYEIHF